MLFFLKLNSVFAILYFHVLKMYRLLEYFGENVSCREKNETKLFVPFSKENDWELIVEGN